MLSGYCLLRSAYATDFETLIIGVILQSVVFLLGAFFSSDASAGYAKTYYRRAMYLLQKTDYAKVVANNYYWDLISAKLREMPTLRWWVMSRPLKIEQYLMQSAAFRNAIEQIAQGKQPTPGSMRAAMMNLLHISSPTCCYYPFVAFWGGAFSLIWLPFILPAILPAALILVFLPFYYSRLQRAVYVMAFCHFILDEPDYRMLNGWHEKYWPDTWIRQVDTSPPQQS